MEESNFFKIDKTVVVLLALVVVLIISIVSLINYQRGLVLAQNADEVIAALPTHKPTSSKQKVVATPTVDPYADWKIYEDTENGFSFKYPSDHYVTSNPNRDGKFLAIVSDDNRETLGPTGWSGIFISIFSNPSKYDSKTFIQWNVKNDPLNVGVTIRKTPMRGLDISITQGELIGANGEIGPKYYVAKDDKVIQLMPNTKTYLDLSSKLLDTFSFL